MKALINTQHILPFPSVALLFEQVIQCFISLLPQYCSVLKNAVSLHSFVESKCSDLFLMSSARTEALIYKKEKKKKTILSLPKCSCIDLCDCQSHLSGAHNANEIKIIDLNPKDLLTSPREAGVSSLQISLLFLTISTSIGPRRTGHKNATGPSITSNRCCFLLLLRKELIQRQVHMENLQKETI